MSASSPSFPQRKYGSVHEDAVVEDHLALQPSSHLLGNTGAAGAGQQRHRTRWRGLAALTLGAAVVGFAYNRQTLAATPRGSDNKTTASLAEVVKPAAAAKKEAPTTAVPFPKVELPTRPASAAQARPVTDEIPPLSFEALNFYHVRDGKPGQDYPWLKDVKLIEPHRETTLSVSSPRDGHEYVWEVRGSRQGTDEQELRASAAGAEAVVILTVLDENTVTLREVNSDGETIRQLDEVVMVKYVRREIRTLTEEERDELMDALFALWDVKASEGGKELYGDDYADIWAIQRLHFKAAMNNDCDHFHDGLGFLTNHALITNTVEYSMQRVNPKLTMPYWDFTIEEIEAEKSIDDDDLKIWSPLFQSNWFGSADPVDNIVKDGRWAWTEIPSVEEDNPGGLVPDVYGLLRSRWNVNSSPYLNRGMGTLCNEYDVTQSYHWPTCELHYQMATEYPDFSSWVWDSMYAPHGPVHTWIGGVLNCEDTLGRVSALVGEEDADALALYAFDQRKNFWRDNFFACEGRATEDMDEKDVFDAGMCGALAYDLTQGDDWKTIYYNSTIAFDEVISEYDDDIKRQVVAEVCASTIHDGDHLQAGSSLDPTFWPMHPTMERLFMFAIMTGNLQDMSWPDPDDDTNTVVSRYGSTCNGHAGSDVFPFGLLDTDVDGFEIKTGIKGNLDHGNKLTNREVLAAMDVSENMLPYVYDNFRWDHCLDREVDFDEAYKTTMSASKRATTAATTATKKSAGRKDDWAP